MRRWKIKQSGMLYRNRNTKVFHAVLWFVFLGMVFAISGCGDFFNKKSTEAESIEVLRELRQVRESPEVRNPLPELYRKAPIRLEIKGGVKIFYFTKQHPPQHLSNLLNEQLGVKGNPNSATNQLVVYCKDQKQADQVLAYLEKVDVPPIQVNIDCLILERFGDITMDWETSILIENFLGKEITLGEGRGTYNIPGQPGYKSSLPTGALLDLEPAFPGASLRETERTTFGLDFGYWIDKHVPGHQVRTIIDLLVSRGYLKILLNPTLEVINGQEATVTIKDYTPIEKVQTGKGGSSDAFNITEYVWVEDTLTVRPTVFADGSVGLNTSIRIGSRSKPEGVVQRSIITERSINVEENRIDQGESLVIGGMRKSEKRSVIRGIPFFKDLPILGIFFSSKDFEEKGTEIIFILTPSISSGGQDHSEVVQEIRTRHADPEYKFNLGDMLKDPLGTGIYTGIMEQQVKEAEMSRVRAEADLEKSRVGLEAERMMADQAENQASQLANKAEELRKKAEKAQQQVKKAQEVLETAQKQRQAEQAEVQKLSQEVQAALEEATKASDQARKTQQQAKKAEDFFRNRQKQVQQLQEKVKQQEAEVQRIQNQQKQQEPKSEENTTEPDRKFPEKKEDSSSGSVKQPEGSLEDSEALT